MSDTPLQEQLRELLEERPRTMPEIEEALGIGLSSGALHRAIKKIAAVWDPDLVAYRLKGRRR